MTDSWDRPPTDPWGRAEQSTQYQDPWGQTQIGPAKPWDGVPQEFQLPPSMTPPSLVPTVLVTALAGLFGLIPASMHAARARSIGLGGERYWQAFGITFAIVSALWIGLLVLLSSWLPNLLGTTPVTSTTGESTYRTAAPSVPVTTTTTIPTRTTYSPPPAPSPTDRSVTSLPSGSWVTVVNSLAKNERSEADAWTMAKSLSRPSAQVVVVDTDSIPGLTPGYWAVAVVGSSSRAEATDLCPVLGRPLGGSCYPRQVG